MQKKKNIPAPKKKISRKENHKQVILLGGGSSITEGIEKGLWSKIKGYEIWSLNSIFKIMPYLPNKQLWVDADFFKHECYNLQRLNDADVQLIAKKAPKYAFLKNHITAYECTRERAHYCGVESINKNKIFTGHLGFTGQFALSLAIAMGYDEIFLFGYDFGTKSTDDKETHVYQNKIHELDIKSSGAGKPNIYLNSDNTPVRAIKDFEVYTQEKAKIWNVSLVSNLPYFEKISYEKFFELLELKEVPKDA